MFATSCTMETNDGTLMLAPSSSIMPSKHWRKKKSRKVVSILNQLQRVSSIRHHLQELRKWSEIIAQATNELLVSDIVKIFLF